MLTDAITDPYKLKKLESEIHGSAASITAPPAAVEAIGVESQALDHTSEADSVNLGAVMTPPSNDVGVEAETESVSEEASAPPTEAQPVDLAPNGGGPFDASAEEEQVTPALQASASDIAEEKAEEKNESGGPDGAHATEDEADKG